MASRDCDLPERAPLYFGMNGQGLRDDLGIMSPGSDAV